MIKADSSVGFDEATDRLFRLFDQAMVRCLDSIKQPRLAITLSGGLDSRVLLAAAKQHYKGEIVTYTFGRPDCDDAIIAKQVASLAGVSNSLRTIDEMDWYTGRELGVWYTDGMLNLVHMHALSSVGEISEKSTYVLNGFLGDAVVGGSYLRRGCEDTEISMDVVEKAYPGLGQYMELNQSYFSGEKYDSLFVYNRGVRFISAGSDLCSRQIHGLKPFMDNDLIEFVYSLPDSYRRGSRLYNAMLLKYYPDFFRRIPWQQTGKPIPTESARAPDWWVSARASLIRLLKASPLAGIAEKMYYRLMDQKSYTSYAAWMKQPKFKAEMERLLLSGSAINRIFTVEELGERLQQFYSRKTNQVDDIGGLVTLAIYLEQLGEMGRRPMVD